MGGFWAGESLLSIDRETISRKIVPPIGISRAKAAKDEIRSSQFEVGAI